MFILPIKVDFLGGGEGGKEKSSGTLKLVNLSCGEKTKKKLRLDA